MIRALFLAHKLLLCACNRQRGVWGAHGVGAKQP